MLTVFMRFLIKCLLAGKSIVTANKEMFAKHWHELEAAAKKGKAGLIIAAVILVAAVFVILLPAAS